MCSKKKLRKLLIHYVDTRLSKAFIEKGFVVVKPLLSDELRKSREMVISCPLDYSLKRKKGDNIEIIEFQFDKYGDPKFIINFGVALKEGSPPPPWGGEHTDQNDATISDLSESCSLYGSTLVVCILSDWLRLLPRWFGLSLFSPKNEQAIEKIVNRAIMLSSEIDDWFDRGIVGHHVRVLRLNY